MIRRLVVVVAFAVGIVPMFAEWVVRMVLGLASYVFRGTSAPFMEWEKDPLDFVITMYALRAVWRWASGGGTDAD